MIEILLNLLLAVLVIAIVYKILCVLKFTEPFREILLAVCLLLLLVWVLAIFGVVGTPWRVRIIG